MRLTLLQIKRPDRVTFMLGVTFVEICRNTVRRSHGLFLVFNTKMSIHMDPFDRFEDSTYSQSRVTASRPFSD